jgi:hypothetical protein
MKRLYLLLLPVFFPCVALASEPVIPAQMVKACVTDHGPNKLQSLADFLVGIGALKQIAAPKSIKTLYARKIDNFGNYEFSAWVDYGNVKTTVVESCFYDPKQKPSVSGSVNGIIMMEPTTLIIDNGAQGQPPSWDGNRGKLWKQFKINYFKSVTVDHPM